MNIYIEIAQHEVILLFKINNIDPIHQNKFNRIAIRKHIYLDHLYTF